MSIQKLGNGRDAIEKKTEHLSWQYFYTSTNKFTIQIIKTATSLGI